MQLYLSVVPNGRIPGWDGTVAAQSHSQLAGTMAGFALAMLAIVLVPFGERRGGARGAADDARAHVVRLLIMAIVILTVAAIEWGALSGAEDAPDTDAWIQIGATACTTLMSTGGVLLVAAICELVFAAAGDSPYQYARTAFKIVASLAVFEVVQFGMDTVFREGESWWRLLVAPGAGMVALLFFFLLMGNGHGVVAGVFRGLRMQRAGDLLGVLACVLALAAFSALPTVNPGVPINDPGPGYHRTLVWGVVASVALAIIFYFWTGLALAPVGAPNPLMVREGDQQEKSSSPGLSAETPGRSVKLSLDLSVSAPEEPEAGRIIVARSPIIGVDVRDHR